jgi:hypothetical protein
LSFFNALPGNLLNLCGKQYAQILTVFVIQKKAENKKVKWNFRTIQNKDALNGATTCGARQGIKI